MGSNQFQKEYIEYLQEKNAELIGRLNYMKQHYENNILSGDLNKQCLMSTLQDVSRICTEIPREIDLFFDKMTAAMNILKSVLLRKAEMVQIVEKVANMLNSTEKYNADFIAVDGSGSLKEPASEIINNKKSGMVKVSPMVNGHIISTDLRIYLNRMPELFTPGTRNSTRQLSPIIEASPDIPSDTPPVGMPCFKEITAPTERLNINKLSFNYMSEESPKSRFKGPKTWKKSLSSTKSQSENQRNLPYSENKENANNKISPTGIENADPLEGPSWLHNENETHSSPSTFMDYKRRKHRFAAVFDKNEEFISSFEGEISKLRETVDGKEEQDDPDGDDYIGDGVNDDGNNNNNDDEVDHAKNYDADGEFYESHETNGDKADFEEITKPNSANSADMFFESFTSESEEKVSPFFKKISSSKKRKLPRRNDKSSVEKNSLPEFEKKCKAEESTDKDIKNNGSTLIPGQLNCSDKIDNEAHDIKSKRSHRRCLSKAPSEGMNSGTSSEKPSCKSECGKHKTETSASGSNDSRAEPKSTSMNDSFEKKAIIKLEDCMLNKGTAVEKSETKSRTEKKSNGNNLRGEFESPRLLAENEGRKKRKAAPTFKLVEPSLISKLRRN